MQFLFSPFPPLNATLIDHRHLGTASSYSVLREIKNILNHNPPEAFCAAQDASARDGASPLTALPLAPALFHERLLHLMHTLEPPVNARVAVHDARLAGRRRHNVVETDGKR